MPGPQKTRNQVTARSSSNRCATAAWPYLAAACSGRCPSESSILPLVRFQKPQHQKNLTRQRIINFCKRQHAIKCVARARERERALSVIIVIYHEKFRSVCSAIYRSYIDRRKHDFDGKGSTVQQTCSKSVVMDG